MIFCVDIFRSFVHQRVSSQFDSVLVVFTKDRWMRLLVEWFFAQKVVIITRNFLSQIAKNLLRESLVKCERIMTSNVLGILLSQKILVDVKGVGRKIFLTEVPRVFPERVARGYIKIFWYLHSQKCVF